MFSKVRDASKVALAHLVARMKAGGFRLLDCQFMTEHLASLGAVEISQRRYLELLDEACAPGPEACLPAGFEALLEEAGSGDSSPGKLIAQSLTQTS